MRFRYLLLLLLSLTQLSCEKESTPEPEKETLIFELAAFLTNKGYQIDIKDDNNLSARGEINRVEFLGNINEFYLNLGFDAPYDLKNLDQFRDGGDDIECFAGPIYHSGGAACQNYACFDD